MTRVRKSLKEWEKDVDGLLLDIRENFIKLGEIIFFAHQDLTAEEYGVFIKHIRQWGLCEADLRAARAAFLYHRPDLGKQNDEERISPELLFAGAKNSKILFMDKKDQDRLLSGEKFQALMSNGKADKAKSWQELSDLQRNMLIGKGGKILTIAEQMALLTPRRNMGLYPLGSVEMHKDYVICTSRNSDWHLQCSLTEFAKMILANKGFWEALSRTINDVRQQESPKQDRSAQK
jgi:hypothetical protein